MPSPFNLRYPLRAAGFVGFTAAMYAALEADVLVRGPGPAEEQVRTWQRRYGVGLCRLFGLEATAMGAAVQDGRAYPGSDARGKGRIFIMNHRSALDVFLSLSFFDAAVVSRADLARWPVIGVAARRVGTLFVDRTSARSGAAVINSICACLERGRGVMLFPEGTTFAGDEVHPFHPGAFVAATRTGAELIPIGTAYEGEASSFMDESFGEHMKRVACARQTRVALAVGEPLTPQGRSVDELRAAAKAEVQRLVEEARASYGARPSG